MIGRELHPQIRLDAERVARLVLAEDGPFDLTGDVTVSPGATGSGAIEYRSGGIAAGLPYAGAVAQASGVDIAWNAGEGDGVPPMASLAMVRGPLSALLRAERPLLNLLQRACGIANATRAAVDAVAGTPCHILHTRKTAPGLRLFDIAAVLAGGGMAHRIDLAHTVMVKDNHWSALARRGETVADALQRARSRGAVACYVEVESIEQLTAACAAGATRLLIDNQLPETVREFAELARRLSPGIEIEATGGIDLSNVRAYAQAGADFVSIGALTHSVRAADLALEVEDRPM
ncbi:MAG: carboxylating nicotinate-nucleotide diphosphorylase [Gemmatimonadales bacterium]